MDGIFIESLFGQQMPYGVAGILIVGKQFVGQLVEHERRLMEKLKIETYNGFLTAEIFVERDDLGRLFMEMTAQTTGLVGLDTAENIPVATPPAIDALLDIANQ